MGGGYDARESRWQHASCAFEDAQVKSNTDMTSANSLNPFIFTKFYINRIQLLEKSAQK